EQHAGRLVHYTLPVVSYSREQLIAGIEKWCTDMRREIPRPWCQESSPPAVQNSEFSPAQGVKAFPRCGVKKYTAHGEISPPAVQNALDFPRPRGDRNIDNTLSKKERGTRLSPEWQPSEKDRDYARNKGVTESQIDWLAEGFKDYWLSGNAKGGGFKI